jgi:hypothetical protein
VKQFTGYSFLYLSLQEIQSQQIKKEKEKEKYFSNMTYSNNPFDHKILQDCLIRTVELTRIGNLAKWIRKQ